MAVKDLCRRRAKGILPYGLGVLKTFLMDPENELSSQCFCIAFTPQDKKLVEAFSVFWPCPRNRISILHPSHPFATGLGSLEYATR
jgi:hypothetical protein